MKHVLRSALSIAALALAASVSIAAPATYVTDKAHTEVGFSIRHFFSKVHGRFTDFVATIQFDPKDLAKSSVEATVQATSISTDNERRDNHLRSDDFFAVEKNPTLTFKSTKITPGKDNTFKLAGDLTMRGVTKPVVFDAELLGTGDISMGGRVVGTRAGFTATTVVNRKDFGISWNRTLDQGGTMLDDNVKIELNVEAVKSDSTAAPK